MLEFKSAPNGHHLSYSRYTSEAVSSSRDISALIGAPGTVLSPSWLVWNDPGAFKHPPPGPHAQRRSPNWRRCGWGIQSPKASR